VLDTTDTEEKGDHTTVAALTTTFKPTATATNTGKQATLTAIEKDANDSTILTITDYTVKVANPEAIKVKDSTNTSAEAASTLELEATVGKASTVDVTNASTVGTDDSGNDTITVSKTAPSNDTSESSTDLTATLSRNSNDNNGVLTINPSKAGKYTVKLTNKTGLTDSTGLDATITVTAYDKFDTTTKNVAVGGTKDSDEKSGGKYEVVSNTDSSVATFDESTLKFKGLKAGTTTITIKDTVNYTIRTYTVIVKDTSVTTEATTTAATTTEATTTEATTTEATTTAVETTTEETTTEVTTTAEETTTEETTTEATTTAETTEVTTTPEETTTEATTTEATDVTTTGTETSVETTTDADATATEESTQATESTEAVTTTEKVADVTTTPADTTKSTGKVTTEAPATTTVTVATTVVTEKANVKVETSKKVDENTGKTAVVAVITPKTEAVTGTDANGEDVVVEPAALPTDIEVKAGGKTINPKFYSYNSATGEITFDTDALAEELGDDVDIEELLSDLEIYSVTTLPVETEPDTTTTEATTTAKPADVTTTAKPADDTDTDNTLLGDLNLDGEVNAFDLVMMKKHILNISLLTEGSQEFKNADINGTGEVLADDLLLLKKYILNIIKSFDDIA
jgi:hypothetical protein